MSKTVLQILSSERVIAFNPAFAHLAGDVKSGLFLSQCCFLSQAHGDDNGWFYSTDSQWYEATLMKRYEITRVRAVLTQLGVISHKVKGQAHKTYYKVNWEMLEKLLIDQEQKRSKNAQMQETDIFKNKQVKKQSEDFTDVRNSHLQMRETDICKRKKLTFANARNSQTKKELREDKERIKKESSLNNTSSGQTVDNSEPTGDPRRDFEQAMQKLTGKRPRMASKQAAHEPLLM